MREIRTYGSMRGSTGIGQLVPPCILYSTLPITEPLFLTGCTEFTGYHTLKKEFKSDEKGIPGHSNAG